MSSPQSLANTSRWDSCASGWRSRCMYGASSAWTSKAGDVPVTVEGDGQMQCRFEHLPLRPWQYVLRLSISDQHQLGSYDVVTAGPRFAVTGSGGGVENLADEEDGLVSLPFSFMHGEAPKA